MASTDLSLEARYAELEAAGEEKRRARMRRQPLILLALLQFLVIGIGLVATVDLRRLQTPKGVALRWTQAATFGDCDDYLHFSSGTDDRARDQICQALRAQTEDARSNNAQIGLAVRRVTTRGATSVVLLDVTRTGDVRHAELHLRRTGGRWRVLRDATSCAVVLCA
ncbi:MAG: hypothetical protein JWO22_3549 [Frankiales bacterium]|nr:hypothetical protein [Frankiales bacterium]